MNTIIEIDRAGRIVVPKKFRDALHLTPGTRLKIEQSGELLTLMPNVSEARLVVENGIPLVIPAEPGNAPTLTVEMVNELIAQGRQERENRILGYGEDAE